MGRFALAIVCSLLAQSLLTSGDPERSEDDRLQRLFREYLDADLKHSPLDASRLGDHRFDHLLDDLSVQATEANVGRSRKMLAELPKLIDARRLTRAGQVDLGIWQHQLQTEIWLAENLDVYASDPRIYNDYLTESTYVLLTQSTLPAAVNVRNCVSRMAYFPRIVEAARSRLKNPPKVVVETAIRQVRGAVGYYESGIFALAGETPQASELRDAAKKVVPLLKEYQAFLETQILPRATGDWRLGKARFARKLELTLDAGLTAEEVVQEAEAEADRVEGEMYVIARQLYSQVFPKRLLPPDDADGRRRTIREVLERVSKDHGKQEELVQDARAMADRIKGFIKEKNLLALPEPDRCQIIEMPEFQRGNSIAFLNPAPPLDDKAISIYAISPPPRDWDARRTATFLEEYNRHMLQILTIHEAYPGHYVQLEYANRHPSLIRKAYSSGVYVEGWAVYMEKTMLDQGYGDGDLALRLNQLKWYLRAVCNAILDYRMHCSDMTDEQALYLLMVRAYQSEAEAILKIIRAKQSSCQLSTYFVGRMAWQRLRRELQAEMGERFDLAQFHEAALNEASIPVKYLPELVRSRLKVKR